MDAQTVFIYPPGNNYFPTSRTTTTTGSIENISIATDANDDGVVQDGLGLGLPVKGLLEATPPNLPAGFGESVQPLPVSRAAPQHSRPVKDGVRFDVGELLKVS